jgi:tetratricopeptide (TPR) repeat protein
MLAIIIIALLALILFLYVAVPLLMPDQSDPLPDERDPVLQDLEEERDALFNAIRELDAREDLPGERREQLRARYEAKAAKVLRTIDERSAELTGQQRKPQTPAPQPRRTPVITLGFLGFAVLTAAVMSGYVLPRVGQASLIASFEGDIEAGRQLQALQQAVRREPSEANLLALADAYWQLGEAEQAEATYQRMIAELTPPPVIAYRRLGFLSLQHDIEAAIGYLEQARAQDPTDLDTLYALAEIYFSQARPAEAIAALETLVAQPEGALDLEAQERLQVFRALAPALETATADPSEANLLALADAYWQAGEQERAADIYVRVISTLNPHAEIAYSRIGQLLFFGGQVNQAIDLLERAREISATNPDTLFFLGNAYFARERHAEAVNAWEAFLSLGPEDSRAERARDFIATSEARLGLADAATPGAGASAEGSEGTSAELLLASGQQLYAANCASCHGVQGQGGPAGPGLVGNRNAAREANVRSIIQYGRGTMPGFSATLDADELEALTQYVIQVLAEGGQTGQR